MFTIMLFINIEKNETKKIHMNSRTLISLIFARAPPPPLYEIIIIIYRMQCKKCVYINKFEYFSTQSPK